MSTKRSDILNAGLFKYVWPFSGHRALIHSDILHAVIPNDKGRKLNVSKTFRRCQELFLNVLSTFNLRPLSRGIVACWIPESIETMWNNSLKRVDPFLAIIATLYLLKKTRKPRVFLMFSGGIKWEHWSLMD